jgi:long-chain acyl-CoA synthetase
MAGPSGGKMSGHEANDHDAPREVASVQELIYQRFLLPAADQHGHRLAVVDGGRRATLEEHIDRVLRLGSGLGKALGIGRSDHCAVMALNGHRYLELYHAAFLGAAVINPLNLRLAPKELEFILSDSETKVVLTDAAFAPVVDRVREAAGVERVVLMGAGDVPHDLTFEEIIDQGEPKAPAEPDEADPVVLMYTGGTTGLPKGVIIDHRAAMLDLYKIAAIFGFDETHVYLHQTPMFHAASFGGILSIPAVGGTTTFVGLFDPKAVLDVIEAEAVTSTVMVPTMIQMTVDHPEFAPERLRSMRDLIYGASPMPTALLEKLLAMFPELNIWQGYGMTENCGLLTMLRPEDHRRGGELLKSAGRPVPGAVVCVQDEEGTVLSPGQTGEICARSGNFMTSYWHRPEETERAFRGGWYHTGDAGYMDDEGYVYLVDRVKDMIVSGGENIYSAQVENALVGYPGVKQVAVIGIPSERWGEAVHAIVVVDPEAGVTAEDLETWARERIAGYKVPKSFELRTEPLPLSGALKILKRELRDPYWEGKDRAVG